jgi:hypothetical protein
VRTVHHRRFLILWFEYFDYSGAKGVVTRPTSRKTAGAPTARFPRLPAEVQAEARDWAGEASVMALQPAGTGRDPRDSSTPAARTSVVINATCDAFTSGKAANIR